MRNGQISASPIAAILMTALMTVTGGCATAQTFVATARTPASVPLTMPADADIGIAAVRFVDIAVTGFQPSPAGPVQIVVDAITGRDRTEIGRLGIYPERAFTAPATQFFGLPVPAGMRLDRSTRLIVRLVPGRGHAEGAMVELATASLRTEPDAAR